MDPRETRHRDPLADTHALRDVAAAGFTVGSHTVTHRPLADLDVSECRVELRESKRRLEKRTSCLDSEQGTRSGPRFNGFA